AVEVEAELVGDRAGDQGLAGAGAALEQRGQAARGRHHLVEAPGVVDRAAVADPGDQLDDAVLDVGGQDDLRPGREPGDPGRDRAELALEVLAERGLDRRVGVGRRAARDRGDDALDRAGTD